jgi:hypothetical protein
MLVWVLLLCVLAAVYGQTAQYQITYKYTQTDCGGTLLQSVSTLQLLGGCVQLPCAFGVIAQCNTTIPSAPDGYVVVKTFLKPTCSDGSPTLVTATLPNTCFADALNSHRYDVSGPSLRTRLWSNSLSCTGSPVIDSTLSFGCNIQTSSQAQLVYMASAAVLALAWTALTCFASVFL